MSLLDKQSVCLRVTHTHRHLTSSSDGVMDEADREVSTLTDRAFRSLCVGDEAVYNDAEFADLPPSPVGALLKPLVEERSRKVSDKAPAVPPKKQTTNGATSAAWQQKEVSSLLTAFAPSKNGEGAKTQNGSLSGNAVESWDKSALRSIQKELAEFSPDFQWSLADGSFPEPKRQNESSERKSDKKSGKYSSRGSGHSSSGKPAKSKHSKLRKLNSRNFFLHSEFSPFQAWKDLNQFPFSQDHISDLLPSESFPRWCDSTFYRHLATHTLSPTGHTPDAAHKPTRSEPEVAQRPKRSHKVDATQRLIPGCEGEKLQRVEGVPSVDSGQTLHTSQKVQIQQKNTTAPKHETAQTVEALQESKGAQQSETGLGAENASRGGSGQGTEGSSRAERPQGTDKLVGGRTEPLHMPTDGSQPSLVLTPSVSLSQSSEGMEFSAPWRRNRSRARSAALSAQWEKGSPAADRPPTTTEQVRKQEVRLMEEPSSVSSTPFNITNLLTPIIPGRQDTESLDPSVLPALFMPASLDLPGAQGTELKPSPEPKARENYRSIASSLLFNLKDNRKRVKTMYSPPKFKPSGDQSVLVDTLLPRDSESDTPAHMTAESTVASTVCSPIPESTSALLLPGNQPHQDAADITMSGAFPVNRAIEAVYLHSQSSKSPLRKDKLSVPNDSPQGQSSQGITNRSPLANKSGHPSLHQYIKAAPVEPDLKTRSETMEFHTETQPRSRLMSIGEGGSSDREDENTPKKSVKERVKELQGQNQNSFKDSKDKLSESIQIVDSAVTKGLGEEMVKTQLHPEKSIHTSKSEQTKQQPPVLPKPHLQKAQIMANIDDTKQSDMARSEKAMPPKQPPPVPARGKLPTRKETDNLGAINSKGATVKDAETNKKTKHIFSDHQNSYIKRQRGAFVDDDDEEEKEDVLDERREAALFKEMKANLKAPQIADSVQINDIQRKVTQAKINQHRVHHTGHASNEQVMTHNPADSKGPRENSGAENKQPLNSKEDQDGLSTDDLTSPLPDKQSRKGVLSLRGNTLAKRDLFTNMEQQQQQLQPQSRQGKRENAPVDKYELAKMALEEVIAEREEKKRKNQGLTMECAEEGSTSDQNLRGNRPDSHRNETVPSVQQDREHTSPSKDNAQKNLSIVASEDKATLPVQSPAPSTMHHVPGTASDGVWRGTSKIRTDQTSKGREEGRCSDQFSEEKRKMENLKQNSSGQKKEERDKDYSGQEPADQHHGHQRSKTPPAVPPRKCKPGMQEGEWADAKRMQPKTEKSAKEESNQTSLMERVKEPAQRFVNQRKPENDPLIEQASYVATSQDKKLLESNQHMHSGISNKNKDNNTKDKTEAADDKSNKATKDKQINPLDEIAQKSNTNIKLSNEESRMHPHPHRESTGMVSGSRETEISPTAQKHKVEQDTAGLKANLEYSTKTQMYSKGQAVKSDAVDKEKSLLTEKRTIESVRAKEEGEMRRQQKKNDEEDATGMMESAKKEKEVSPEVERQESSRNESERSVGKNQKEPIQKEKEKSAQTDGKDMEEPVQKDRAKGSVGWTPQETSTGKETDSSVQKDTVRKKDSDMPVQKSPKTKQSKSYMRDFLSLLGLASEEKVTDEQQEAFKDNDKSISEPTSPKVPMKETPNPNSVTIHDIMQYRSPLGSPLQPTVKSPFSFEEFSSRKHVEQNVSPRLEGRGTSEKDHGTDCNSINGDSESRASERPMMSPLSDVDKGGWVRNLIEHAQNLTPKSLTPVNLTPSESNASSPAPMRPVLFKVKDNTCITSPVTKTVRPILHKSLQDLTAKPWSPRESLSGSERGEEEPEHQPRETSGIPILVDSASPLPSEISSATLVKSGMSAPTPSSPLPQHLKGQMLTVPEEEGGRGSVSSGVSSGLSEGTRSNEASVGDTAEEKVVVTGQTEDTEVPKAPSERSGSVCSGTEGSATGKKPPPVVLPKSEKAMKRAMKLTRRIQRNEGKNRADHKRSEGKPEVKEKGHSSEKSNHEGRSERGERAEPEGKKHRSEKTEPRVKDHRGERSGPTEHRGRRKESTETRETHQRKESGHNHNSISQKTPLAEEEHHTISQKQTLDETEQQNTTHKKTLDRVQHHTTNQIKTPDKPDHTKSSTDQYSSQHLNRKGRSTEKHTRIRQGQMSQSTDRHVGSHRAQRHYDDGVEPSILPNQQAYYRTSPSGSHGDRRSKSLERDLLAHPSGFRHRDDQRSHQYKQQSQTGRDINVHEPSVGSANHPSPNGLFVRHNSSEPVHPHIEYYSPSILRQNSSEVAYSPLAMRRSSIEHSYAPVTRQQSGSEQMFHPSNARRNSFENKFHPSTGRQNSVEETFRPMTIRQNSSEQMFHRSNVRRDSTERTFQPVTLRQNSSEHMFAPSEQMYPMTQRKLLQDPDSGQYFVVDMPVQVKTKTFFDPETGNYVQLPVQSSEGAVPTASSVEMLKPSLVVYHGYVPMPVSSLPQQKPTAPSQPFAEDLDDSAAQWLPQDSLHNSRKDNPYIEPVYVPQDRTPEEELDSVR